MKRFIRITLYVLAMLSALSCSREREEIYRVSNLPDGTPATLCISFGSTEAVSVDVSTKAESAKSDEARVHDLYVMIFDNSQTSSGSPKKIYGRYFSYEHLSADLSSLDTNPNEGWWVENKTIDGASPAVVTTAGAVKVSTVTCSDATLVLIANVANAVSSFGEDEDDIAYLNAITDLGELKATKVKLEQDVVNRKDLFLMMGQLEVNTSHMVWGELPKVYDSRYKVSLQQVDAKVKFLVRCDRDNISAERAVYWQVCNVPDRCYLFADYNDGAAPDDVVFFDSAQCYFEGTETHDGYDWYVFTFYMMENRQACKKSATTFHDREKKLKTDSGDSGYQGPVSGTFGDHYVNNGKWEYANDLATYVQFDMVLTLTPLGISRIGGASVGNALTTDTIFSVHLGDFGSSGNIDGSSGFNDYNTVRSHYYTYKIFIANSTSIYAEVDADNERQPGQEGFLLLTSDEIVNADCHYEYHSVSFPFNESMDPSLFSWYVKTPFGEGGPYKMTESVNGIDYPVFIADESRPGGPLDYKWVMFAVNNLDPNDNTKYATTRRQYPGIGAYDSSWKPSLGTPHPQLMDINQLIEYIFDQTAKEKRFRQTGTGSSDFLNDTIKVTIYIDEYYYETNPLYSDSGADPDLWRKFVNASPREMHILSDARQSRDRQSDVILSSHSIIQQSIQTIYNTYAPGLRSLWGCEHIDEIKEKAPGGWLYWPESGCGYSEISGADSEIGRENGRLNTAYIWNLYSSQANNGSDYTDRRWDTYLDFDVDNNTPELKTGYEGMAFSCFSRNRDNNGNGVIDRDEVRWYMASTRQLIGMWVGNESLSLSARLYQPSPGQWRAHIVSSTAKKVCWSEEGAGATDMYHDWDGIGSAYATWNSPQEAAAGESVRCLRNVGTYDAPSGVTDISYAPYSQQPDKYFTLTENGDNSYTFHFDRLNTRSIREYSEGELPYHEQTSLNNRVYVKMVTQSRDDDVTFEPVQNGVINMEVTSKGKNDYCPEGYRFPNQTEWVLMSLYLPSSYLQRDKDGNNYSPRGIMPSRTYYDRGYYGHLKDLSAPWSTEAVKVGWMFSDKLHCADYSSKITRSRCVKDDDMTGVISGEITLDDNKIYANDWTPITFNFSSTASAFTYASLKLCYTAHSGNYRELDVPVENTPTGLQYRETQNIAIPDLATLGLEVGDYPVSMTLQGQVRNVAGLTKTVNVPLTLENPLSNVTISFPKAFDADRGLPVHTTMSVRGHHLHFSSATLYWKESGGSWNAYPLSVDHDFDRNYSEDVYIRSMVGDTDFLSKAFVGKKYSYKLTVVADDGSTFTTPAKSMEILRYGYEPNPVPAGGWTSISQCNGTWQDQVTGLDFSDGDFIEAEMDLTNCVYVYIAGNDANDLGKDNILGFSTDDLGSITNSMIWYYPSVQRMVAPPGDTGWTKLRIHAGRWNALEIQGVLNRMNLILDKDGIIRDGTRFTSNPGDWNSRVKGQLTSASTIYVGSVEGIHHSRAKYDYVRVIRNREQ